ncbi:asparagine synthase (glutamine-hydrolyzing) [Mesorhizobium sp.]|jgi:asparagine synthase (glutamine-hydrolysing)|uniref:asparagine synthase (glutamine-hydrolyzing) n=1 Tax=Mesorhizobium sp. TaxID=1871066 RepID=UPI000FE312BA|nr:asparagine synthase (glutamine-hydrolyzing) [Mesorhizobium sp.]RWH73546.1 MAG: asparagine synthase (glutamine-hydrolyzing) [Mesorhizobium sp.]RWL31327.1 MAG: asparagine synthase (glutamine-hydrolyzing) [Mesorhizobium sp.]RWL36612.1 MAG: asparagine synthase (glutamine-hydrolyzing) [Mesorhizobium sp.]RWL40628.1 MAG: asparagine synthase (glutamine-hydrolyzing) [Mesorhizobium sp.]RWL58764.1 MAG: asparagine synthase (glutamine-hydrolyzing) [Mesorhizobium sp.]
MCGIAGILALNATAEPPSREALLRMAGALAHRGPDERGLYRDRRAGLAHARLSVVDLQHGQQPLADPDGPAWIVFNGEIFNYLELRDRLFALGHRFHTRSDTEVVLHAYREWGQAAFERMNGQWALAIWDPAAGRLVLSRDRYGICPLHFCEHGGRLFFASEVKAIFAAEIAIPRAFDPAGIDQTFTMWTAVAPQNVFQGIRELPPGHVRLYDKGAPREHPFWQPRFPEIQDQDRDRFGGSRDEAVEEVRLMLEGATALRIVQADVPVGCYLSGGLDSSLVATLGRRFAGERFQTFSLRFADAEYDETEFQRLVADATGSEHHELVVSRGDIAAVFPEVIRHTERPILRTAPAPLFLLSRLVRERGIKVVLTGEGADEMFAGYDLFREGKVRRFWGRQPASTRRARLLERLYPYLSRSPVHQQGLARQFFGRNIEAHASAGFAHDTRWRTTSAIKRLFCPDMRAASERRDAVSELISTLPAEFLRWSPLAQDQYIEIRTLMSGYLLSSQGDRMLMAHSVEGRFPFLDDNVVSLANALPDAYKLRGLDEKHVLKRVAAPILPPEVVARKKQPYRAPNAMSFFADDAPAYIADALSETAVRAAGVFDPESVSRLVGKCQARTGGGDMSNSDNMALVGVLSTQLLHQQFVATRPAGVTSPDLSIDVDYERRERVPA